MNQRVYFDQTPDWLQRPGRLECGRRWTLIRKTYAALTDGLQLPEVMPTRERRTVDGVIGGRGRSRQIIEVDEKQHFNVYRTGTLAMYPRTAEIGFPKREWLAAARPDPECQRGLGRTETSPVPHARRSSPPTGISRRARRLASGNARIRPHDPHRLFRSGVLDLGTRRGAALGGFAGGSDHPRGCQ